MRLNSSLPPPVAETASPNARMVLRELSASMPVEISNSFAFTRPAVSNGVLAASCLISSKRATASASLPSILVSAVWYCSSCALYCTPVDTTCFPAAIIVLETLLKRLAAMLPFVTADCSPSNIPLPVSALARPSMLPFALSALDANSPRPFSASCRRLFKVSNSAFVL